MGFALVVPPLAVLGSFQLPARGGLPQSGAVRQESLDQEDVM
jgi:hypothetical protein